MNKDENEGYQKQFNNLVEKVTYDVEVAITRAINAAPEESMHIHLMLNAGSTAMVIIAKKLIKIAGTSDDLTKDELILLASLLTFRYATATDLNNLNMGNLMRKAIEDLSYLTMDDDE